MNVKAGNRNNVNNILFIIAVAVICITAFLVFYQFFCLYPIDEDVIGKAGQYIALMAISFQVTFLTISLLGGLSDKTEKIYWIIYPEDYLIHGTPNFRNLSSMSYLGLVVQFAVTFVDGISERLSSWFGCDNDAAKFKFSFFITGFLLSTISIVYLNSKFTSVFFKRDRLLKKAKKEIIKQIDQLLTVGKDETGETASPKMNATDNGINEIKTSVMEKLHILHSYTVNAAAAMNSTQVRENLELLLELYEKYVEKESDEQQVGNETENEAANEAANEADSKYKTLISDSIIDAWERIINGIVESNPGFIGQCAIYIMNWFNQKSDYAEQERFFIRFLIPMMKSDLNLQGWFCYEILKNTEDSFWGEVDKMIADCKDLRGREASEDLAEYLETEDEIEELIERYRKHTADLFRVLSRFKGYKKYLCDLLEKTFVFMKEFWGTTALEDDVSKYLGVIFSDITSAINSEDIGVFDRYTGWIHDNIEEAESEEIAWETETGDNMLWDTWYYGLLYDGLRECLFSLETEDGKNKYGTVETDKLVYCLKYTSDPRNLPFVFEYLIIPAYFSNEKNRSIWDKLRSELYVTAKKHLNDFTWIADYDVECPDDGDVGFWAGVQKYKDYVGRTALSFLNYNKQSDHIEGGKNYFNQYYSGFIDEVLSKAFCILPTVQVPDRGSDHWLNRFIEIYNASEQYDEGLCFMQKALLFDGNRVIACNTDEETAWLKKEAQDFLDYLGNHIIEWNNWKSYISEICLAFTILIHPSLELFDKDSGQKFIGKLLKYDVRDERLGSICKEYEYSVTEETDANVGNYRKIYRIEHADRLEECANYYNSTIKDDFTKLKHHFEQ